MNISMTFVFFLGAALSLGSIVVTDDGTEKLFHRTGNIVMLMAIFFVVAS